MRAHPFAAADLADLADVLERAGAEQEGTADELVLSLPSGTKGPAASPELGRSAEASRLAEWRIPALSFEPAAALELLENAQEGDGVLLGGDVSYLAVVAGDAVDMVRRGRVLPTLVVEDGVPAARWRPVLAGANGVRFRELAAAMPPICRAEGGRSVHVLVEALAALTDAAARRSLPPTLLPARKGRARDAFTEHWTDALTGRGGRLPHDDPDDAGNLAPALQDWFTAAHQAEGDHRVCLRLVEPRTEHIERTDPEAVAEERDRWRIVFSLQAVADLSLQISAADLWAGETFPGLPDGADDVLLEGLGRAARILPALNTALRDPHPCELLLDTEAAHGFLSRAAPLLRAAGFGVQLPAWAGRSSLGLKLTTSTPSDSGELSSGFGLRDLVEFRWDLALGEETIDPAELAELVRLKIPLVRLRGTWVELDERGLSAALEFLRSGRTSGRMRAAEVIEEVVRGGTPELPLVDVAADGPLGDLLSGEADRRLAPRPTPAGFHGTLRPYQERGLAWLDFLGGLGLGSVLADDMGLGKTAQTLALLLLRPEAGPTLLICPMSLVGNWQREAARFAPDLDVYVHHGQDRYRDDVFAAEAKAADLVVTTYGTALRDRDLLASVTWGRVVADEAQAIKNPASRQARAVRSLPAGHRVALTGTPVENHLGELWSIMEFVSPGLLGTRASFRERFAAPIEREADPRATAALKRATRPFVLRRLKTDKAIISDLPEKMEMTVYTHLTAEQASLYQATVEDMMHRIENSEGIERRGLILATMTRLKQVCNHPAHLLKDGSPLPGRSGKLERLEEILAELLTEGDKALVFTQYTEFGDRLRPYLAARLGRPVLWLHGGTPRKERDALISRFSDDPEPAVFLLSLKAAGTGLNLTAANHVVHFDRWWNPAVENQATDRAFRIGQTKNVQVRKLLCVGTLEERVDALIERKRALAEQIVGSGEDWLTELSVTELREVFALSAEAVSA